MNLQKKLNSLRFGVVLLLWASLIVSGWGCRSVAGAKAGGDDGKSGPAQTVTLKTTDGWTLVGDLYAPKSKAQGAVLLLHQRGGQASDWVSLCRALQKANIIALALDQRGAGRSTQGPGPTGGDAPWATSGDIAAGSAFLQSKASGAANPAGMPLGLAGASYGANNALIYAAAHPDQIKAVALFSPGANYHTLDALTPAKQYKGSVEIYHDKNDSIAGSGPARIDALLTGPHKLHLSGGSEHGTDLLTETNLRTVTAFFQHALK